MDCTGEEIINIIGKPLRIELVTGEVLDGKINDYHAASNEPHLPSDIDFERSDTKIINYTLVEIKNVAILFPD